jgi:hypothetical protein
MKSRFVLLPALFATALLLTSCLRELPPDQSNVQKFTASTPVVVASTPPQFVSPNKKVFVAFSHDMDAASLTPQNIEIRGVNSAITYDATNRIAYLTPSTELAHDRTFEVNISTAVRTATGQPMVSPHRFAFRTKLESTFSPPTVQDINGECVPSTDKVFVRFSEPMDSSTINSSTFFVEGVSGTVTYDAVTRIATFTPDSPFTVGVTFTAHVTTDVQDLSGVNLQEEFIFTFDICAEDQPREFCTFTPGGFQGGGEPGELFDENFTTVFPNDLIIGIFDGDGTQHHIRFTANQTGMDALKQFLTSPSLGPSGPLPSDLTNPTATPAGHLPIGTVALTLNIGFSGVGGVPAGFGDLVLVDTGTSLDGATVSQILAIANQALAGNGLPVGFTFGDLNDLVTNLNEAFSDCQESGWATAHLR